MACSLLCAVVWVRHATLLRDEPTFNGVPSAHMPGHGMERFPLREIRERRVHLLTPRACLEWPIYWRVLHPRWSQTSWPVFKILTLLTYFWPIRTRYDRNQAAADVGVLFVLITRDS